MNIFKDKFQILKNFKDSSSGSLYGLFDDKNHVKTREGKERGEKQVSIRDVSSNGGPLCYANSGPLCYRSKIV